MADKEKKDAVETTSRPQIRRSRKKTDTDAGTDQAQMTTTDALEGEAETKTIRRRRTTVAGEKTTKTTSARSTRKKTDESEAAQDRQYHLLPDALAQAEAEQKYVAASLFDEENGASLSGQEEKPKVAEKPRRRRRPLKTEDEAGIPSISLADELAAHEKAASLGEQGGVQAEETSQTEDRSEDMEVGSFSSFVAQLSGNRKPQANKTAKSRTARTTRTTKQAKKSTQATQENEAAATGLAEEAAQDLSDSSKARIIVPAPKAEAAQNLAAEDSEIQPEAHSEAAVVSMAEAMVEAGPDTEPAPADLSAQEDEDDSFEEESWDDNVAEADATMAESGEAGLSEKDADKDGAEEENTVSAPADAPLPTPDLAESEQATPADPLANLTPEEIEHCERIAHHVSLQESKASSDDDVTPFIGHFQYGDGRVETCLIGSDDVPPVFAPADENRAHNFFRICRHVHIPEDNHATPLPEDGIWIPPHPAPRPSQAQAQRAAQESLSAQESVDNQDILIAARDAAPTDRKPRILVCWVGKVDISAALRHDIVNPGPIRMLLQFVPAFDYVLLLTAANQNVQETLKTWLAPCISPDKLDIKRTAVTDLSDHTMISQVTRQAMENIVEQFHLPENGEGVTYHLSPGSPVTHAVLLLLATIRYNGVTLMQTRLAGIGKDPDILTVSLQDMLTDQSVPNFETLKANIAQTIAERKEAARAEGAESVLPEPGERRVPLLPKPRHRLKARDLVQRFRSGRKTKASAQTGSQTVLQPKIQVVQAAMERPFDFDMPSAVQDETSLRAPVPSIGKPSRIAPSAPMPKEGEPPVISAELGDVYKKMQRVATMFVSILLLGESGSGKSRLARYIHEWSGRTGKFVSLDCAGLTDDMFYTELFGRAGANVTRPREGAFRKARSGTLFLENVNRLTPTQQSMLVRVLATAGETRLSLPAATPYPACTARVRVIASALPTLMDDVRSGHFRTDLYYRLAGVSSLLPPVREYTYDEREDLLRSFLVALQQKLGQCWNFSGEAWETLIEERWPGNLREVSRILQQICLLSDADSTISREDVLVQLQQSRITDPDDMPEDRENTIQDYHFGLDGYILPRTDVDEGDEDEDEDEEDYDHDLEDELDELRRLNEKTRFFELGSGENLDDTLSKMRLAKIVEAMDKTNGNRVEAAKLLGLSYVQLNYTLKQLLQNRHKNGHEG